MKKKMTSRERRAEERRILAEMDAAMSENKAAEGENLDSNKQSQALQKERKYDSSMPERVHCKRCKTLMEQGVCPTCGFKIYMPMDEEKRKKIRLWVTVGAVAVFVVLFVMLQFTKQ